MTFDLARFDPFEELADLRQRMNRVLQEIGDKSRREPASTRMWAPVVDVVETAEALIFKAEVPGVKREDIDIEVTNEGLTIRGERKAEPLEENVDYVRRERAFGPFQRTFTVGIPVQHDKVTAGYKDGVLEVTLPKSEEVKPKRIQVAVE